MSGADGMNLSVLLFKTGQEATGIKRDQYIVSAGPLGPRTRSWGDSQDKARPISEGHSVALSQDGKKFPVLEHIPLRRAECLLRHGVPRSWKG